MNCQYFRCLNQIFELNKIHVQFGTLMNYQLRTSKDSYQQNCGVKENMCSLFPAIVDFQSFFFIYVSAQTSWLLWGLQESMGELLQVTMLSK